ncbi:hypothetical protein TWF730_004328 [Orbilia blumenaviensis]|uniref:Amine oxidase domain-containing protein n=1 Tax=Orbilia blumenaviensis TaxID=1796055 RepID=A0AAV9U3P3_9PEZI
MTLAEVSSESDGEPLKKVKALVIGAGTSGLRAAEVLIQAGCEVKVLEARDRIGGRIATSSKLGLPLDLGANWIHGNIGNPILAIAESAGSSYSMDELDDTIVFAADGSLLPKRMGNEVVTKMWDYFEEGIIYSAQNAATIQSGISFMDYYKEKVAAEGWDEERSAYQIQVADLLGNIVATEIRKQDFRNLHMEEPIPGDNLFLSSTYGPVMDLMAQTVLKTEGCLELDKPVKAVETVQTPNGPVHSVYTKDGEVYTADAVLCSIPLGSLKQDRVKFKPPIPEKIRQSIKHLGYGSLEKTYITFPKAFWKDGASYFAFLADPATDSDRRSIAAISLAHIPEPYAQPTLLFYTHGETSKQITSILQFSSSEEEARAKILTFFHPYISKLHNYSPTDPDCVPRDYISTNWLNDEYAGNGSYTNFPVGLVDGVDDVKTIEAGVEELKLWFCGEHTAPLLGLASVSGAYWAGEIAAKKCLGAFGIGTEAMVVGGGVAVEGIAPV